VSAPDPQTLAVYDAKAEDYSEIHHGRATAARLTRFIASLPPSGTALDLGCGPGWAAAAMRDAGLSVTAMDASPEMARVAKARHGLDVTVGPFEALTAQSAFDGVWAHFCLLHAPRAALPAHLVAIRRALRPGGRVAIAMKLGDGEARDRLGRLYTYVGQAELGGLLAETGFAGQDDEVYPSMGFDGTPCDCLYLTARRD